MKKILTIMFIIVLSGCTYNKFYLEDNLYNSNIEIIDNEKLIQLEKDKSFILLVSQVGCSLSHDFDKNIEKLSDKYNLYIYKVMFSNIDNSKISKKLKYYPSLVIYKDGKVVDYLKSNKDKDLVYYENNDKLIERIEKKILLK